MIVFCWKLRKVTKMELEKVEQFAKESGLDSAIIYGKLGEYTVYEPVMFPVNGIIPPTGLPCLIIDRNGELEWISGKAVFELLQKDSRSNEKQGTMMVK